MEFVLAFILIGGAVATVVAEILRENQQHQGVWQKAAMSCGLQDGQPSRFQNSGVEARLGPLQVCIMGVGGQVSLAPDEPTQGDPA